MPRTPAVVDTISSTLRDTRTEDLFRSASPKGAGYARPIDDGMLYPLGHMLCSPFFSLKTICTHVNLREAFTNASAKDRVIGFLSEL